MLKRNFRLFIAFIQICFFTPSALAIAKDTEVKNPAITMLVEEVSDEIGIVSTSTKKFRLNIEYSEELFQEEDIQDLESADSVFLKNLRIISRSLNTKKKNPKSVLDDYSFVPESESDSTQAGFKRVIYISNDQIIKRASRINFRIDVDEYLEDNFIDSSLYGTRAAHKIDVLGLETEFNDLSLDNGNLVFTKLKTTKRSKVESNEFIIIGELSSNTNITDLIKRDLFSFRSAIGKKIRAKIKIDGTRKSQNMKVISSEEDISVSFLGDNKYQISIPIKLQSKNKLSDKQIELLSVYNSLIVPIIIKSKTGDNLDININGILRQQANISGEL